MYKWVSQRSDDRRVDSHVYAQSLNVVGQGHTSVGHVGRYTDLVTCVLVQLTVCRGSPQLASWSLRGPSPQALTLLGGARFIVWRLRRPSFGECRRGLRHFWECWACLGYVLVLGPTLKKALCHTRPVGWTEEKYRRVESRVYAVSECRWAGTHLCVARYTDLVVCVLAQLTVCRGSPRLASSSLSGPSPQALTRLGEVRFITWRLKHPSLVECRRAPRHFLEFRACVGYTPAPGLT